MNSGNAKDGNAYFILKLLKLQTWIFYRIITCKNPSDRKWKDTICDTLLFRRLHVSCLWAGAWRCQDNIHGGSWLVHSGAAGLCCSPTRAYLASKTKCLVEWHVTYKHFRSWILWMGLCFSEMTLFCRLLLLIHRAWSCLWHLLCKESLRVSHSRESRGEKYELKLLNFYPKKPHKWRRFSIYTSSMMFVPPHERLLGQDICQTGGVLMLMIVYTTQFTVRRFGQLLMALALFLHT